GRVFHEEAAAPPFETRLRRADEVPPASGGGELPVRRAVHVREAAGRGPHAPRLVGVHVDGAPRRQGSQTQQESQREQDRQATAHAAAGVVRLRGGLAATV